jgi:leader peptidase (prepilin peptidase)/N-methyltransferase
MLTLGLLLFFILGSVFGSFINMAVYRTNRNQNYLGKSYCNRCKKPLRLVDNIPIISFIFLKGSSSCCKYKLPKFMLCVELITAVVFSIFYFIFSQNQIFMSVPSLSLYEYNKIAALIFWLVISVLIIFIFVYDLKYYEIPYWPVAVGYFSWAVFTVYSFYRYKDFLTTELQSAVLGKYMLTNGYFQNHIDWFLKDTLNTVLFAIGVFIFFLFLFLITKGKGMGFGDVYTAPLFALLATFPGSVIFLFSSFIVGAIYGLAAIAVNRASIKTQVPFGPFMVVGLIISLTIGPVALSLIY